MSKKPSKQAQSVPDTYKNVPNHNRPNICIVEDVNGNISLHNDRASLEKLKSFNALIKDTIAKCWDNFDAFLKESSQTILTYHANIFNAEPPKDQLPVVTALHVWNSLIDLAKSDLTTEIPTSSTGRKSTILTSTYQLGDLAEGIGDLKTPQALACLRIFRAAITKKNNSDATIAEASSKPMPKEYVTTLTEAELRDIVIANAGELHTRQDPWRIFQYYRPQLIANKLIKRTS